MKTGKFIFEDAQGMAAQHPETFDVDEIAWLKEHVREGCWVKVCIQMRNDRERCNAERIWTKVVGVDEHKVFATLANEPYLIDGKFGDPVEFELRHIYSHADASEEAEHESA